LADGVDKVAEEIGKPSKEPFAGCLFRKSSPDVVMMQSGQGRDGNDDTGSLNRPSQRRILAQYQVRSNLVVYTA